MFLALVGAFSVITNLRMDLFEALLHKPVDRDLQRSMQEVSCLVPGVSSCVVVVMVVAV